MTRVGTDSPYYPYELVQEGFVRMDLASDIPLIICKYLLDLPLPGYTPPDNNAYPRCRLMKRLWYDTENPLANPIPTPEQKLSLLYNGDQPVVNSGSAAAAHPKGYRLYPIPAFVQSQTEAEATIKCYIGREIPLTEYVVDIGLIFDIYTNASYEPGMGVGGLSKSYAMEKDIISALHGVNLAGIGTVSYSRSAHADNGSTGIADESGVNVGRRLKMSIRYADDGRKTVQSWQDVITEDDD